MIKLNRPAIESSPRDRLTSLGPLWWLLGPAIVPTAVVPSLPLQAARIRFCGITVPSALCLALPHALD
jgi:hypothetical protein